MKRTYEGRKGNVQCEPGRHFLRVIKAEEKISQNCNDMLVLTLQNTKGETARDRLVFTEKSMFVIDTFLKSAGKVENVGDSVELNAQSVIGWCVYADVGRNENGYAQVNAYLEHDQSTSVEMPPEVDYGMPEPGATPPAMNPDDIPF
jgi:hypothetical protein